jgi:hypothetical protein
MLLILVTHVTRKAVILNDVYFLQTEILIRLDKTTSSLVKFETLYMF